MNYTSMIDAPPEPKLTREQEDAIMLKPFLHRKKKPEFLENLQLLKLKKGAGKKSNKQGDKKPASSARNTNGGGS